MGSIIDRALDIINDHLKDQTSSFQVASPLAFGRAMAQGGEVLQDEYPTHYLPHVGRQVMADGGLPVKGFEGRVSSPVPVEEPVAAEGVEAYHGSPHEFEEFDPTKIGTGEGAQVYGHGLYFAGNENIAKYYRDSLTDPDNVSLHFKGRPVDTVWNDEISDRWGDVVKKLPKDHEEDFQTVMGNLSQIKNLSELKHIRANLDRKQNNILDKVVLPELSKPETGSGHVYEVRLDAHPEEHLLDWDKPLKDQHPNVIAAFNKAVVPVKDDEDKMIHEMYSDKAAHEYLGLFDKSKGSQAYKTFAEQIGGQDKASEALSKAGIRGIRYLDAGSRGQDEKSGSHNYVIFDPQHIKVKRRYAEGGEIPKSDDEGIVAYAFGNSVPHIDRSISSEYQGSHQSPGPENGAPLWRMHDIYPDDLYSPEGFRYYADFGNPYDMEGYHRAVSAVNHPSKSVTIYRAVPKESSIKNINPGDWVTLTRDYAKDHGESSLQGEYKILKKDVRARDLFTHADSIHEFGYHPQPHVSDKEIVAKMSDEEAKNKLKKLSPKARTTLKRALEERIPPAKAFGGDVENDIQLAQGVEPATNTQQLTDTAPFKKWFAGSKVVDESGDPLRLYHGTTVWNRDDGRNLGDFNEFDRMASVKQVKRQQWLDTIGSWFSDNPGDRGAGLYAGDEEGGTIYPVHLNIKNPLRTDFDWLLNKAKELGPTIVDKFQSTPRKKYYKAAPEAYENLHNWIKEQGYDGVIIPKGSAKEFEHQNVYIALHPTQIKSATGNIGDFDPSNPDIRKNTGGPAVKEKKTAKAYGGAIYTPELQDDPDDIARRLILWSYAAAPLGRPLARAEGGAIDDPVNKAASIVGAPASAQNAVDIARNLNPMGFYSAAAEAASKFPQKAPIDQIISKIKGQPNVKTAELDNANLKDAFAGQRSVDPQEVARHLQASVPQIKERIYGGKPPIEYKPKELLERPEGFEDADDVYEIGPYGKPPHLISVKTNYDSVRPHKYSVHGPSGYHSTYFTLADAVEHANNSINNIEQPLYKEYTVPGGENYREVVMHTSSSGLNSAEEAELNDLYKKANAMTITKEEGNRMQSLIDKDRNAPVFNSSHWQGVDNPLAHLRMSDRDDGKTLHLEELQSDWGQEGRKNGFSDDRNFSDKDAQEFKSLNDRYLRRENLTPEEADRLDTLADAQRKYVQGVPSAPYVTDTNQWVDLGLKRALMEAAKGGYDKLIWTPGEAQADRYDLSKHIDELYHWRDGEKIGLSAYGPNGTVLDQHYVSPSELDNVVGKDLAKDILEGAGDIAHDQPEGVKVIRGEGLKVGGEGMKSFYDKLVPQRLSKLISQHDPGAKVEKHSYPLSYEVGTGQTDDIDWEGRPVEEMVTKKVHGHVLHITPKLRAAILKGLPAFRSGGDVGESPIIDRAFKVLSKLPR